MPPLERLGHVPRIQCPTKNPRQTWDGTVGHLGHYARYTREREMLYTVSILYSHAHVVSQMSQVSHPNRDKGIFWDMAKNPNVPVSHA